MSIESPDFLKHFGEIKFAEENSMCINDFELALKKHVFGKKKIPSGYYKFGEIHLFTNIPSVVKALIAI